MNKPREMPLDEAMQKARAYADDKRNKDIPSVSRTLVREIDRLERTVAELREYAVHPRECASICRRGRDPIYCTCGLDAILARLDGSKP